MTEEIAKRFSWTQPSCDACWDEHYPRRTPSVLIVPEVEECVYCGQKTKAGIYVRIDPSTANHPTLEK